MRISLIKPPVARAFSTRKEVAKKTLLSELTLVTFAYDPFFILLPYSPDK